MAPDFLPASFTLDDTHPSGKVKRLDVTLNTRAPCPQCGPHGRIHSRGFSSDPPMTIFDLPRTVPIELHVRRRRYECQVCKALGVGPQTFSERGPDTHPRFDMTTRLYRYAISQVAKVPLDELERTTGVPAPTLWAIATDLSQRLDSGHRFPTPSVLAIDGIKIAHTEYMVVADGATGRPIAFLDSTRAAKVAAWAEEYLDLDAVEVFVADLHRTNTSVARIKFPNALYVADKWHVIQRLQRVLSQVINKEIDDLRKAGQTAQAATIYDFKPGLMAVNKKLRKTRRSAKGGQRTLSFMDDLLSVLTDHPRIRRAFWARYDFLQFYNSRTLAEGEPWLERCRRRLRPFADLPMMKEFESHLTTNWDYITNYFQTVHLRPNGRWRGWTTNGLEQHNGEIRKRVRVRHGVRNFDLLRLVSVYGARDIGEEILLCSGTLCGAVTGPVLGPPVPPEIRLQTGTYWRCSDCR